MPKGKTNQPLTFMIPEEWMKKELFKALEAQGHTLLPLPKEAMMVDVIFGVNCHFFTDDMMIQKGIFDVALRVARKRKKQANKDEDKS